MEVVNSFMTWIFKNRIGQIDNFKKNPIEVQRDTFEELIASARRTE